MEKQELVGPVSNCCGASPKSNGDTDTMEFGICPDCKEHCEYVYYDEDGNEVPNL